MTRDDALKQLSHIARERAFGRHVGSDRLIQAGLDALIAGVESSSLAMLAGLLRSEEPEAPALFDQVLEELGLLMNVTRTNLSNQFQDGHRLLDLHRIAVTPLPGTPARTLAQLQARLPSGEETCTDQL